MRTGATNGMAGAFSEWVPVLHIVGVPSTGLQSKGAMLHHTLGDGRFDAFQNIYSNITVTQAHIKPPHKKSGTSDAGEEIDRAIFEALKNNKPTYLTLPTDLVDSELLSSFTLYSKNILIVLFDPFANQARSQQNH